MPVTDNKVVMFVDLLGFTSLTEAFPVEPDLIRSFDRPFSWDIETIIASQKNLLTRSFTNFHHSLKSTIDIAKMRYPLTVIAFSDSAFVATTRLFEAGNVAVSLLQSLLRQRVPARIGIAYGSFGSDLTLPSTAATTSLTSSEPEWSAPTQLKHAGSRECGCCFIRRWYLCCTMLLTILHSLAMIEFGISSVP
jgi:hypothetical protein